MTTGTSQKTLKFHVLKEIVSYGRTRLKMLVGHPGACRGLGWTGLDWAGLGWAGLGWTGLDWAGLGWTGLSGRLDCWIWTLWKARLLDLDALGPATLLKRSGRPTDAW